ncbi:Nuclear control of ATPase protein 2 [Vanrija albida]|uniref:Nuclear control of ATPase protein 2 n=1 Tax=Vanrija albida TaxID=181172 RepID=A0ABR3PXX3_9TREE
MVSIFVAATVPSYAEEQLRVHLGSLATLPVAVPAASFSGEPAHPSPQLSHALGELNTSKPPSAKKLASILDELTQPLPAGEVRSSATLEADAAAEAEIITRAVSVIWAQVMQAFVDGSLQLEEDRVWWDLSLNSKSGVLVYFVQSLPERVWSAVKDSLQSKKSFSIHSVQEDWHNLRVPSLRSLFRPLHDASAVLSSQLTAFQSPLELTRREMQGNKAALGRARDTSAARIGQLAEQGPHWALQSVSTSEASTVTPTDLMAEATRLYGVLCSVLDVPTPAAQTMSSRRRPSSAPPSPSAVATPTTLLALLNTYIPKSKQQLTSTLQIYGRPSVLTRLWFPFLFAPPALYWAVSALVRNKDWVKEQVVNAKETIKGFIVQWVWEPIEGIAKTMRGGGEGLDVAPETVKADQESLERMVVDLGRDYYHLSGPQLDTLKAQVEKGDMESVLKVYEQELQHPLRNALTGNLIRTLLIQVQKTKTDLSRALLQLDHLLRSQQLTFAFVGVAPSVLVVWALWGWLRGIVRGENRGKGRRRRYFNGMREVERLLIVSPEDNSRMSDRDRGTLIVSVSGLRTWAAGITSTRREGFLDDLRMVEDPVLGRDDKLRVVERIYRCWGVDGRGTGA